MTLVFSLLGPVHATLDGRPLELGGPRGRRVLAALALEAGRVVPAAGLAAAVWDDPPATAREQLQNAAGALRRLGLPVARTDAGFVLDPGHALVDVREFARLRRTAEPVADPAESRRLLGAALELWRGPVALGGLRGRVFESAAARLEQDRLDCVERALTADLALGRHASVCGELAGLTAEHPLRERLVELHMLALYRSGRRGEALAAYDAARRHLAAQAGLDPGPGLRALHARLLADADPPAPAGAAAPVTPARLVQSRRGRRGQSRRGQGARTHRGRGARTHRGPRRRSRRGPRIRSRRGRRVRTHRGRPVRTHRGRPVRTHRGPRRRSRRRRWGQSCRGRPGRSRRGPGEGPAIWAERLWPDRNRECAWPQASEPGRWRGCPLAAWVGRPPNCPPSPRASWGGRPSRPSSVPAAGGGRRGLPRHRRGRHRQDRARAAGRARPARAVPRRAALRGPARRRPDGRRGSRRGAGRVPARPRRGRPGGAGRRRGARGPVPEPAGRAAGAGPAGQRGRRGPGAGPAARGGGRLRGARHRAVPAGGGGSAHSRGTAAAGRGQRARAARADRRRRAGGRRGPGGP